MSIVAFIPSFHGSNLFIALWGAGPGLYVDLERFSFHVPTIGSLAGDCLDIRSSCSQRQTFVAGLNGFVLSHPLQRSAAAFKEFYCYGSGAYSLTSVVERKRDVWAERA